MPQIAGVALAQAARVAGVKLTLIVLAVKNRSGYTLPADIKD
jgi:hypothetical protein